MAGFVVWNTRRAIKDKRWQQRWYDVVSVGRTTCSSERWTKPAMLPVKMTSCCGSRATTLLLGDEPNERRAEKDSSTKVNYVIITDITWRKQKQAPKATLRYTIW